MLEKFRDKRVIAAVFLFLLLIVSVVFVKTYIRNKNELKVIEENVSFLKNKGNKNLKDIEKEIRVLKVKEGMDSKVSYKQKFENTMFLGDSLTEPLIYFDFITPSNVIAKKGYNLVQVNNNKNMKLVENQNPENIILFFGLNDVNVVPNIDEFINRYDRLVKNIKAHSKESKIFIINITVVTEKTQARYKGYRHERIKGINKLLEEYANKNTNGFIDVDPIILAHKELYTDDGIHLKKPFYPMFLDKIYESIEINKIKEGN